MARFHASAALFFGFCPAGEGPPAAPVQAGMGEADARRRREWGDQAVMFD